VEGLSVTTEVALFMVAQAIILAGVVITAHIRTTAQLTAMRVSLEHYEKRRGESLNAHLKLVDQVAGISRVIERHDTLISVENTAKRIVRDAAAASV